MCVKKFMFSLLTALSLAVPTTNVQAAAEGSLDNLGPPPTPTPTPTPTPVPTPVPTPTPSPGPKHCGRLHDALARFDANGDGVLSAEERAAAYAAWEARRKALLDKYDTNHDGVLSREERAAAKADWLAQQKAEQTAVFVKLDVSGDGKLSLDEFKAGQTGLSANRVRALFNRLDRDHDTLVSLEEFLAHLGH